MWKISKRPRLMIILIWFRWDLYLGCFILNRFFESFGGIFNWRASHLLEYPKKIRLVSGTSSTTRARASQLPRGDLTSPVEFLSSFTNILRIFRRDLKNCVDSRKRCVIPRASSTSIQCGLSLLSLRETFPRSQRTSIFRECCKSRVGDLLREAEQMCTVVKMIRHVAVAAFLTVLVSGAPRSSIIYADDRVVSVYFIIMHRPNL